MARLPQYPLDLSVDKTDVLIGSDNGGTTKNYSISNIGKAISKFNVLGQPQICYRYNKNNELAGNLSIAGQTSTTKTFTSISSVIVSKFAFGETSTAKDILLNMVDKEITITDIDNPNNFGSYSLDSATVLSSDNNFYTLALSNTGGAGNIVFEQFYIITKNNKGSDLSFVFNQGVPATTWNIQHNLGKFPSVSVINNNDVVINGEVTYIDNNNVQLNFSAGFTGKAYLN